MSINEVNIWIFLLLAIGITFGILDILQGVVHVGGYSGGKRPDGEPTRLPKGSGNSKYYKSKGE